MICCADHLDSILQLVQGSRASDVPRGACACRACRGAWFVMVGEKERRTPGDRATTSQRGMAIGFGSKLVGPFYQAIAALQPDVQPCVDMLNDNVDVWTKMDA